MGTYIHLWTEARAHPGAAWHLAEALLKCTWCAGAGRSNRELAPCYWCGGAGVESRYCWQDYTFFAALAGVRGGEGDIFPGDEPGYLRTSDDAFAQVAPERGLPDDLSAELTRYFEEPETELPAPPGRQLAHADGYATSWVLLSELAEYLEHPPRYRRRAFVHIRHLANLPARLYPPTKPIPEGYCWVGPRQMVRDHKRVLAIDEANRFVAAGEMPDALVHVAWETDVRREVDTGLLTNYFPAWRKLAQRASDVRLVFAFV